MIKSQTVAGAGLVYDYLLGNIRVVFKEKHESAAIIFQCNLISLAQRFPAVYMY